MTEIYFYGAKDETYGYMSNFYKSPFVDGNGIKYCCSEQYFMYQKCLLFDPNNLELQQQILSTTSAVAIKRMGRQVQNYNNTVWDECRYSKMVDALYLKFRQNRGLQIRLLETGSKILYEASSRDRIWGIGYSPATAIHTEKSKFGRNLLGHALMEVRALLL